MWLAAYWCLYQSCCNLPLWTTNCSCIGFLEGLEGEGALDWSVVWRDYAVCDALDYYSSHGLGETGVPLRFFVLYTIIACVFYVLLIMLRVLIAMNTSLNLQAAKTRERLFHEEAVNDEGDDRLLT